MKFLIVGFHCSGKQEVLDTLENLGINCGKHFSNFDNPHPNIYNSYNFDIFDNKDINEIFENNAYIYFNDINIDNHASYKYYEGITKYEFDNNDVFALSPDQFLKISAKSINDDVVIVWMDNNKENRLNRYREEKRSYSFSNREELEKSNINLFAKTIYNFNNSKLIYFINEDPNRVAVIIYTLIKHPELIDIYSEYYN